MAAQALLNGEAETLTRRALQAAIMGDIVALRLCIERVLSPRRDIPVTFSLPTMSSARDAAQAAGAVLRAVSEGEMTPGEGAVVMGLVDSYRRTLETSDLEARLAALEGN